MSIVELMSGLAANKLGMAALKECPVIEFLLSVNSLNSVASQELSFAFGRPVRFVDMEGNTSLFVEPTEIADRYQRSLANYLKQMQQIVLETGVDYHRVTTSESYEHPMMRFLVGRTRGRGVR